MAPIAEVRPVSGYKERFVLQLGGPLAGLTASQMAFWQDFSAWLLSGRFKEQLLARFKPFVSHRFEGVQGLGFRDEAMLVEDLTNYALGPTHRRGLQGDHRSLLPCRRTTARRTWEPRSTRRRTPPGAAPAARTTTARTSTW